MPETLNLFDYASLDNETSVFLRQKTAEVKALMRQTIETLIKTGTILMEVKNRLPYGQWSDWCEVEFGWDKRTADRMINVAEKFSLDSLSNLDLGASALYILSAPTTPEKARQEALNRARQGQKITMAAAQDIREQHLAKTDDSKAKKQPLSKPKTTTQKTLNFEAPPEPQAPIAPTPTQSQLVDRKAGANKRERLKQAPGQQIPALVADKKLITSKAKTVEAGQTWRLGGFHILFCGEPTDPKFVKRLPQQASLFVDFSSSNPLPTSFIAHFQSHLAFKTSLSDFDLGIIREIVKTTLEGTTDGGDRVVLYGLPDPAIFLLIDQLDCIAYCTEPDAEKCNMAIAAWTQVTKRAASRI